MLPHFQPFGWMVLGVETTFAVLLLTGTLVRLAALAGVAQSLAIALSVAHTPGEWPWSYWMMIGIHVVLLGTAAGRVAAVDAVRAEPVGAAASSGARRLLLGWGVVVGLTAVIALVMALGEDFLDPSGARLADPTSRYLWAATTCSGPWGSSRLAYDRRRGRRPSRPRRTRRRSGADGSRLALRPARILRSAARRVQHLSGVLHQRRSRGIRRQITTRALAQRPLTPDH
ncbi:MAG: hypothetical protein WKF82_00870 [Nocardioidaceae bacterium]